MARYTGPKEKIERRIGEKLFLKGERSYSPKAAIIRKPYPPGLHGRKLKNKLTYEAPLRARVKLTNKILNTVKEQEIFRIRLAAHFETESQKHL